MTSEDAILLVMEIVWYVLFSRLQAGEWVEHHLNTALDGDFEMGV